MPRAWIVVEAEREETDPPSADSAAIALMVRAIAQSAAQTNPEVELEICPVSHLGSALLKADGVLLCPLTLNIPETLHFPASGVYQICRDVLGLRQRVEHCWDISGGEGGFWLPIVLTAKGPVYAEVIGKESENAASQFPQYSAVAGINYAQPVHLSDARRQKLYELAHKLLRSLQAPPATYLMQFGFQAQKICFDRLWPFPAIPALASIGVQLPDLFTCHWYCLMGRPIHDLTIIPPVIYPLCAR